MSVVRFTVLGGSGFIGSHLISLLKSQGFAVFSPSRNQNLGGQSLGHVIFCVGLTADFRERPFDTVQAHVCHLLDVLRDSDFDSLVYLSSTRIYDGAECTDEDAPLSVHPDRPGDLYNISKIMGESLCLGSHRLNVRVARLSNVCGRDPTSKNFLTSVIREALEQGRITLRTSLESAKDYVSVRDVVALLPRISLSGCRPIYNVASGRNVTHGELIEVLQRLTGCAVHVEAGAETVGFPVIRVERARDEFGFSPEPILDTLDDLINQFRGAQGDRHD